MEKFAAVPVAIRLLKAGFNDRESSRRYARLGIRWRPSVDVREVALFGSFTVSLESPRFDI